MLHNKKFHSMKEKLAKKSDSDAVSTEVRCLRIIWEDLRMCNGNKQV